MFEIVKAGGWVMWPIILCSITAVAIIGERLWALRKARVAPAHVADKAREWLAQAAIDPDDLSALADSSPLGRVLASGLANCRRGREIMKEAIEDAGRQVTLGLERYLNTLGTIATISPFLGLLGTVLGMINMFSAFGGNGVGDPAIIAHGIAQALITTASGLTVAVPSLIFYRYFRERVDKLILAMEAEAVTLLDLVTMVEKG